MIAIDQYGTVHHIQGKYPRKELLDLFGRKSAQKMYVDKHNGDTAHIGYVIARYWLTLYKRYEQGR